MMKNAIHCVVNSLFWCKINKKKAETLLSYCILGFVAFNSVLLQIKWRCSLFFAWFQCCLHGLKALFAWFPKFLCAVWWMIAKDVLIHFKEVYNCLCIACVFENLFSLGQNTRYFSIVYNALMVNMLCDFQQKTMQNYIEKWCILYWITLWFHSF